MNTIHIVIVAVLVVALGVGGYVYINKETSAPTEQKERSTESEAEEKQTGFGSLKNLFSLGRDLMCTIRHAPEEGGAFSGVVYLSGEKMRGDFVMEYEGARMETAVIQDGTYAYTWGSTPVGTMAMKYELDAADGEDASQYTSPDAEGGFDVDQNVEYECDSWRADQSKFVPPSDITFTDVSASMNTSVTMPTGTAGTGDQCAACAQIPDAGIKAQCLAALGCN